MKIFVTGANGFVGSHLVSCLLSRGHQVTAAVRRRGTAPAGSHEQIIGPIGRDSNWATMLSGHDAVIHLAARVHVMRDRAKDPLAEFRQVNTAGTEALARAASDQEVARFIFLSSIKVNGEETGGIPFSAINEPKPVDPYGISKHEAETVLRTIESGTGLQVCIVRAPLVYGPGVRGNFRRLLVFAHRGVPLPLGSVNNRRTMVSIWNLTDLLEKIASDPGADGALVLAGDAGSRSTPELLRGLSVAMGAPMRVFPFPLSLLRIVGRLVGRPQTIERLVGSLEVEAGSSTTDWTWAPQVDSAVGLARTAAWYMQNRKEKDDL